MAFLSYEEAEERFGDFFCQFPKEISYAEYGEVFLSKIVLEGRDYYDVSSPWGVSYPRLFTSEEEAREVYEQEKTRIEANLRDHGDGWDRE